MTIRNGGEKIKRPARFGPCPRCGRQVLESDHRFNEGAPGPIVAIWHLRCRMKWVIEQQDRER